MIEFVIVISRVFSPTTPTSIWNKCLLHKNRVLKSKRQCNHDSIEDKWFYIICAGKFLYEINWCRHSTLLSFFSSFYFFFFDFGLCCVIIIIINCFHSIRAILLFDMKHNNFTHTKISSRKCFVRVFIHISLKLFLTFYLCALLVLFFLCFFFHLQSKTFSLILWFYSHSNKKWFVVRGKEREKKHIHHHFGIRLDTQFSIFSVYIETEWERNSIDNK